MKQITRSELHELGTSALGLDPGALDLASIEAIAGSLRRAASFLCPCETRVLIDAIVDSLEILVDPSTPVRELVEDTLAAMVGYGDLIEVREGESPRGYPRTLL